MTAEYTSHVHETFIHQDRSYLLGHKINLKKVQRTAIVQTIFSKLNRTEVQIDKRTMSGKSTNVSKLNNIPLNNP